jgi:hypothetical protein
MGKYMKRGKWGFSADEEISVASLGKPSSLVK